MFSRILVAVDGSETSKHALMAATALAREQMASLHIVHVVETVPIYVSQDTLPYPPAELMDALREEGRSLLADAVEAARAENLTQISSKLIVIERANQRISEAIEDEAVKCTADLIVLGTHGRRGFRRLLLGSVAENLIRVSTKPVLLIRTP